MGDFNYPQIDWFSESTSEAESYPSTCFLSCIQDCFLSQHVREPTHYRNCQTANTLDLVLTNGEDLVCALKHTEPIGKSHHATLVWTLSCYQQRATTKTVKYSYDKGDYEGAREFISAVNWQKVRGLEFNDMWSTVKGYISEVTDKYIPHFSVDSTKVLRRRRPPWMDDQTMEALRQKKRSYGKYLNSKNGNDYSEYVKLRNAAKTKVRRALRNYERDIAAKAKKDPKAFYRYTNSKLKNRGVIPDLSDGSGSVLSVDSDKADAFNSYFSSAFTSEDMTNIPEQLGRNVKNELVDIDFTCDDVLKHLLVLKADKSPRLLKECAHELSYPLYILYRKSLEDGNIRAGFRGSPRGPGPQASHQQGASHKNPLRILFLTYNLML